MRKYITLFFILIIFSTKIYTINTLEYKIVSPQTENFMRYGETPVSMYNGIMNINIPIYEINDTDFNIPISLSYSSDGFKPNVKQGIVGINWCLNVGGCITRDISVAPDDGNKYYDMTVGLFKFLKDKQYKREDFWLLNNNVINEINGKYQIKDDEFADLAPDIFTIKILDKNISFMMDLNGEIKTSIKGYNIDITKMSTQYAHGIYADPFYSEIKVTDPLGYIYIFGGDPGNLEFSASCGNLLSSNISKDILGYPTINAWYLSKIIAPNGRKIKFNYIPFYDSTHLEDNIWQNHVERSKNTYVYTRIKGVILKSIFIEDRKYDIQFSYSSESAPFYPSSMIPSHNNKPSLQLDSINVLYDEKILPEHRYIFSYEEIKSNGSRRFLSSFSRNELETHSFEYFHPTNVYPIPVKLGNIEVDNDGYYTTGGELGLLKIINYPTGGCSHFSYEPHTYSRRYAMLLEGGDLNKKLTIYDENKTAGGYRIAKVESFSNNKIKSEELEYLYLDDYSPSTDKNLTKSSGIYTPRCPILPEGENHSESFFETKGQWSKNFSIGTPHITYEKVYVKQNDGSYSKYIFSSVLSDRDFNTSNLKNNRGELIDGLSFISASLDKLTSSTSKRGLVISRSDYSTKGNLMQSIKNSYKESFYQRESLSSESVLLCAAINGGIFVKQIYLGYHPLVYTNLIKDGVTVTDSIVYNQQDNIIREKRYVDNNLQKGFSYNYTGDIISDYQEYLKDTVEYRIYSENREKIIRSARATAELEESMAITEFDNCLKNCPSCDNICVETLKRELNLIRARYDKTLEEYPIKDIPIAPKDSDLAKHIQDYNLLNYKTTTFNKVYENTDSFVTSGLLCFYNKKGNSIVPYQSKRLNVSNINLYKNINSIKELNDIDLELITEYKYNNNLNLQAIKGKDNISTVYLLSYSGQHPIAEIKNATYEEVKQALSWDDNDINSLSGKLTPSDSDFNKINSLRQSDNLKNAIITTYKYRPLIGMIELTDPRGVTTYYEYDVFNRLKRTYIKEDGIEKTIQSYDYHYRNQ